MNQSNSKRKARNQRHANGVKRTLATIGIFYRLVGQEDNMVLLKKNKALVSNRFWNIPVGIANKTIGLLAIYPKSSAQQRKTNIFPL